MQQTELLEVKRLELIKVASAMLVGEMNLIEGVRLLCSLRFAVEDPENEVFLAIRGVESETDTFPLGEARSNYSPEYLARVDGELRVYLEDASDDILRACEEILRAFS